MGDYIYRVIFSYTTKDDAIHDSKLGPGGEVYKDIIVVSHP